MTALKMTVNQALALADDWVLGTTFHADSRGANAIMLVLATEVRRLREEVERLRADAERLDWLADNLVIEGFVAVSKDIYEFATDAAEKEGREEPAQSDQRAGLRLLIDAAMEASNAG